MRTWLCCTLVLLLYGCSVPTIPFLQEKEIVVDVQYIPCPDFEVRDCTAEYPETTSGLAIESSKELYQELRNTCKVKAAAMKKAQRRCFEFDPDE